MGQTDHGHLSGHHRVWRNRHLLKRFQQHLPHSRQHPHRDALGEALSARALVWADGWVLGRIGCDNHDADPVGQLGQIAQDRYGISTIGILRGQLTKRARRIAAQDRLKQIQPASAIREAQHRAHFVCACLALALANGLIQQTHCVAHRPFGGARDQGERVFGNSSALKPCDLLQMRDHHFGLNPP